jgi:hypothetical protein
MKAATVRELTGGPSISDRAPTNRFTSSPMAKK